MIYDSVIFPTFGFDSLSYATYRGEDYNLIISWRVRISCHGIHSIAKHQSHIFYGNILILSNDAQAQRRKSMKIIQLSWQWNQSLYFTLSYYSSSLISSLNGYLICEPIFEETIFQHQGDPYVFTIWTAKHQSWISLLSLTRRVFFLSFQIFLSLVHVYFNWSYSSACYRSQISSRVVSQIPLIPILIPDLCHTKEVVVISLKTWLQHLTKRHKIRRNKSLIS